MITITVPQYWTTFKTLSDLKILQRWQCDLSNVHFFNGVWLWKEGDEDYFARVHKYHWSLSKFYFVHFIAQGHEASRRPHDIFLFLNSLHKSRFLFEIANKENSGGSIITQVYWSRGRCHLAKIGGGIYFLNTLITLSERFSIESCWILLPPFC